jgi:hypothetical protein
MRKKDRKPVMKKDNKTLVSSPKSNEEKSIKLQMRLPDESRFEIELPVGMTVKQLKKELTQHFNLDRWWRLLLKVGDGKMYNLDDDAILSDLIVNSSDACLFLYPEVTAG